jgi:uncharacterized protein (DUF2249 family)
VTITAAEAYDAIRAHHTALSEDFAARADAVSGAAAAGLPHGAPVAAFIAYLAGELLPHAAAEEEVIYPVCAARANLADLVGEMIAEHGTLAAAGARLATITNAAAAAEQAQQIASLFTAHAAKENALLLPPLVADQSVNLAGLLEQMHGHAGHDVEPAGGQPGDAQAEVLSLLLQAAAALARAGEADRACRIAASAWAALQPARPELAAKVTTALHGLTRKVADQQPEEPGCCGGHSQESGCCGGTTSVAGPVLAGPDLDVRDLPPALRHATIFDTYHELLPGTGFVLINDHDPKPLMYQFEAQYPGEHTWDYLEGGPRVWRVRIGRPVA